MTAGTDIEKAKTTDIVGVPADQSAKLMEGYAGFVNDHESTAQDRITRLAGLVPVALQVMDESRDTVEHLRDELDEARRPKYVTKADWPHGIMEIHHNTLVDLYRQFRAVGHNVDYGEYVDEIYDVFGPQMASAFNAFFLNERKGAE